MKIGLFYVSVIAIPAIFLWIILTCLRVEDLIRVGWEIIFIPVYIIVLSWLLLIIANARASQTTHLKTLGWFLAWTIVASFLWMLISNLDADDSVAAFSWSMTIGPLVLILTIAAMSELVTLVKYKGTTVLVSDDAAYSTENSHTETPFLERRGIFHTLVWFVAEVTILVFVLLVGRKLDVAPGGPDWGLVFIPAWFAFGMLFAVLVTECAVATTTRRVIRKKIGSMVAFFLAWVALLVSAILLNVVLDHPTKLSVWAIASPVFVALGIFECYVCVAQKDLTSDDTVFMGSGSGSGLTTAPGPEGMEEEE
jgi:hypothetical protein